jgi:predicted HicB family RNase H-like nuclease
MVGSQPSGSRKVALLVRVSPEAHAAAKASAARRGDSLASFVEKAIRRETQTDHGRMIARLLRGD